MSGSAAGDAVSGGSLDDQLDDAAVPLVGADTVPDWLRPLIRRSLGGSYSQLRAIRASRRHAENRQSAVLMLLGDGPAGPDLLLTQRAPSMRTHAGQPAFPGGAIDAGEDSVAAALREGQEETGVDPSSVTPLVLMPRLHLRVSDFVVQPVLAYWHRPGPITAVNSAETAAVARVPIADLVDPAHRIWAQHGSYRGVGFEVSGMVVWGFTGMLVDALLDLGGWSQRWDYPHTRTVDLAPAATDLAPS